MCRSTRIANRKPDDDPDAGVDAGGTLGHLPLVQPQAFLIASGTHAIEFSPDSDQTHSRSAVKPDCEA